MRDGVDTGSGMWVVRERVLFGECRDVIKPGEREAGGAGVLRVCRWRLCRGLRMKQCRSRLGTCNSHDVPELAHANGW